MTLTDEQIRALPDGVLLTVLLAQGDHREVDEDTRTRAGQEVTGRLHQRRIEQEAAHRGSVKLAKEAIDRLYGNQVDFTPAERRANMENVLNHCRLCIEGLDEA